MLYTRKGGVGKTSTTVNLGAALAKFENKKVLILDIDPQVNTVTYLLKNEGFTPEHTLDEYIKTRDLEHPEKYIHQVKFTTGKKLMQKTIETDMFVIPATRGIDTASFGESEFYVLKELLNQFESQFDYCLIDCPANASDLVMNALVCSDYLLVPCTAETDSINGYDMVLDEYNMPQQNGLNSKLAILGVLLNNVDGRRGLEKYLQSELKMGLEDVVFSSYIRRASEIDKAKFDGIPVPYYMPSCPVARDYGNVTKEIIKRTFLSKRGE